MQAAAINFVSSLVSASKAMGSFLDVARFLGVAPKQVFLWVAEIELPAEEQRRGIEERLRSLVTLARPEA